MKGREEKGRDGKRVGCRVSKGECDCMCGRFMWEQRNVYGNDLTKDATTSPIVPTSHVRDWSTVSFPLASLISIPVYIYIYAPLVKMEGILY